MTDLTIDVESDFIDGGYVAFCVEYPGAAGQGETEQEAIRDLLGAVAAIKGIDL